MSAGRQRPGTAIAGLGITEVGKVFGRSATQFASDAVRRAVSDASSAGSRVEPMKPVSVKPGETRVQRRFSGASSCRITSHRARTADLLAA